MFFFTGSWKTPPSVMMADDRHFLGNAEGVPLPGDLSHIFPFEASRCSIRSPTSGQRGTLEPLLNSRAPNAPSAAQMNAVEITLAQVWSFFFLRLDIFFEFQNF